MSSVSHLLRDAESWTTSRLSKHELRAPKWDQVDRYVISFYGVASVYQIIDNFSSSLVQLCFFTVSFIRNIFLFARKFVWFVHNVHTEVVVARELKRESTRTDRNPAGGSQRERERERGRDRSRGNISVVPSRWIVSLNGRNENGGTGWRNGWKVEGSAHPRI